MWLIPTRNRPDAMKALIASMWATGCMPTCAVMVDGPEYDIEWPSHWKVHNSEQHLEMQLALNALFDMYPDEPTYGILTDQSRPQTPWWETHMEHAAGKRGMSMANTLRGRVNPRTGLRRITSFCIGGDLARAVGCVWPRWSVHLYGDDFWEDVGYGLGVLKYLPEIVVVALLKREGEVKPDENHRRMWNGKPYLQHDKDAYEKWRSEEYEVLMEKLSAFKAEECSLSSAS